MKILIVKTSSLGDVIHMLPAVTDAARAMPGVQVDWLVEESFAAIPAWHPAVQHVLPIAMRRWKKHWTQWATWREMAAVRHQLQTTHYDRVIDTQGLLKSALWTRVAQGPRCGYNAQSAREPLAAHFYDQHVDVSRELHAIERNRRLLAQALGYALDQPAPDYGLARLAQRLPALDLALPERFVLGLHGTSRADKEWPVAHWIQLAQAVGQVGQSLVLPWGNAAEHRRALFIAAAVPSSVVLPRLGLDALAVITERATAVVGVDTGLMHLAAALGKPGLALYTATRPALTGVVPDRHSVQALTNRETATALSAQAVITGLLELLPPA